MRPANYQIEASQFCYERDHSMVFAKKLERRGKWKRPGTLWQRIRARYRIDGRTGCHIWTALLTPKGYARMWWDGRNHRVSRLIWTQRRGRIPQGKHVLHKCDNPACVRLAHLFLGDNTVNMRDRDRKGRQARGIRTGGVRLTDAKVRQIRRQTKISASTFARKFGVAISTVCRIRSGATWSHL